MERTMILHRYRKIVAGICVITYFFTISGVFIPCPHFDLGERKYLKVRLINQ